MQQLWLPVRIFIVILFAAFDVYAISLYYQQNDRLPFNLSPAVQREIAKVLPAIATPEPTPIPISENIEFSESQWIGSIVYGKLTNHNSIAVAFPTIRFSLSKTKDEVDVLKTYTATVAAKIEPNESVYFSQRFSSLPNDLFWWSSEVDSVQIYSDQKITKPPTGQQVSATPITIPTTVKATPKDTEPWGVAKQIDDVTWTIKVGQDDRMATPQETFTALNEYRQRHGSPALSWDDNLASYATERASYLNSIKTTDAHAGFKSYIANEDNIKKLGFWSLGENSGYGSKLIGVHLIEWIYAADEGHNTNQLDKQWSHVGIGISGLGVAFIFGGDKM